MSGWLDYATQVSELEKIAKLAPSPVVARAAPELLAAAPDVPCLVCGAVPARACAACASVSYCGALHQASDARFHDAVCETLRDIAEDVRARASENPEERIAELLAAAARWSGARPGWADFLGAVTPSRERRLSELATRPMTLASMLVALDVKARTGRLNVHVMAASQRELEVPLEVWARVGALLNVHLDVAFVGPELAPRAGLRSKKALYQRALWSELGRPDLVIGYNCGLMMYPTWKATILDLRGSGVPFVVTSFRAFEAAAEARLLSAVGATCLFAHAANPWASLAGKRSSTIANDVSFDNAYVSAWR